MPFFVSNGDILPETSGNPQTFLVNKLIPALTNFVFAATLILAIVMIILGGWYYIFSGGEDDKKNKGKEIIQWALIGVFVATASFGAVKFLLGLNFFS